MKPHKAIGEREIHHIRTCLSLEELAGFWNALNHELPMIWARDDVTAAHDKKRADLMREMKDGL